MMTTLAKVGFSQSYTYFTWKNTKAELIEYMTRARSTGLPQFFRPNFFANTPDILHEYLQRGGRPAFEARLVLAATLVAELRDLLRATSTFENVPVRDGQRGVPRLGEVRGEEAARSTAPLLPLVRRLNEIRRENPALPAARRTSTSSRPRTSS